MTEEKQQREPVVPEGVDAIDGLTVAELDATCHALGADVALTFDDEAPAAIQGKKYGALALLAFRWAKRTEPHAKLDEFRDMHLDELSRILRLDDETPAAPPAAEAGDEIAANPTGSAPAS